MRWRKRSRIEAKCLLCGHITPFKSIEDVSLEALSADNHACTATPAEVEAFRARMAEPRSAPDLVECPACTMPLGWVHADDPRVEALRAELIAGCVGCGVGS